MVIANDDIVAYIHMDGRLGPDPPMNTYGYPKEGKFVSLKYGDMTDSDSLYNALREESEEVNGWDAPILPDSNDTQANRGIKNNMFKMIIVIHFVAFKSDGVRLPDWTLNSGVFYVPGTTDLSEVLCPNIEDIRFSHSGLSLEAKALSKVGDGLPRVTDNDQGVDLYIGNSITGTWDIDSLKDVRINEIYFGVDSAGYFKIGEVTYSENESEGQINSFYGAKGLEGVPLELSGKGKLGETLIEVELFHSDEEDTFVDGAGTAMNSADRLSDYGEKRGPILKIVGFKMNTTSRYFEPSDQIDEPRPWGGYLLWEDVQEKLIEAGKNRNHIKGIRILTDCLNRHNDDIYNTHLSSNEQTQYV